MEWNIGQLDHSKGSGGTIVLETKPRSVKTWSSSASACTS